VSGEVRVVWTRSARRGTASPKVYEHYCIICNEEIEGNVCTICVACKEKNE